MINHNNVGGKRACSHRTACPQYSLHKDLEHVLSPGQHNVSSAENEPFTGTTTKAWSWHTSIKAQWQTISSYCVNQMLVQGKKEEALVRIVRSIHMPIVKTSNKFRLLLAAPEQGLPEWMWHWQAV